MSAKSKVFVSHNCAPARRSGHRCGVWDLRKKICGLLNPQELAEVLKWPFCAGEAPKMILTELEKKTGRTFGGDIWKFVEQAPSLGIKNLDRPAKRPKIEDAINELEKLRAGAADKPGVQNTSKPSNQ